LIVNNPRSIPTSQAQKTMPHSKIIPYVGGKSDRDISIAVQEFQQSGCRTFVDRFAGSHRVSLAILKDTDAWVDAYEIDPQINTFMKVLILGDVGDRRELEARVDLLSESLALAARTSRAMLDEFWEGLRLRASERTDMQAIAAFVVYIQNAGSSNPRRNLQGKRNSGYALNKIKGVGSRKCKLLDLSQYADRILFNPVQPSRSPRFVYADVPYYYPGKTPCYEGHQPGSIVQAREYLELAIASAGHDGRVMYCNYLHVDILDMMAEYGVRQYVALDDLNTATNQGGKPIGHGYWLFDVASLGKNKAEKELSHV
jgi:hypothetical protein